jgi:hypothetical protein
MEAVMYDDQDAMKFMYALKLKDMRDWCEEQLDLADIPRGAFRDAFLHEMFRGSSEEPYDLWKYIQDKCEPDPEEEEAKEDEEAEEEDES